MLATADERQDDIKNEIVEAMCAHPGSLKTFGRCSRFSVLLLIRPYYLIIRPTSNWFFSIVEEPRTDTVT